MTLDFSRCRHAPFAHQREDTQKLVENAYFFVASEMRTGKTKIVIDAAQFLFERGVIDRAITVAPASVRDVWYDAKLGELAKHLWDDTPAIVTEFHARRRHWLHGVEGVERGGRRLEWVVTNFEYLRSKAALQNLLMYAGPKTLLVLDESSYVKNYRAQQTKACLQLRRACGRVVLLNGTPVFHSPLDLFSQCNILHPSILDCPYVTHFKARYAVQSPVLGYGGRALKDPRGNVIQKVESWTNLDDIQRRMAPHTVRRLQRDCLDLPPKLDPVIVTAPLTAETWRAYQSMKRDLLVWLKSGDVSVAKTAAIRVLRLSQITSGFLGGVEDANIGESDADDVLNYFDLRESGVGVVAAPRAEDGDHEERHRVRDIPAADRREFSDGLPAARAATATTAGTTASEIGREKLDALLSRISDWLESDPLFKIVVWCRFRPELDRMMSAVAERFAQFERGEIHGGQKKSDRLRALQLLNPETSPADAPVFVGGTFGSGSFGLNFTAAHTSVALSSDYSPGKFAQSADRVYGPGQTQPIAYFEVIATGPKGQRTIDHDVAEARRSGEDLASRTASAWVKALEAE